MRDIRLAAETFQEGPVGELTKTKADTPYDELVRFAPEYDRLPVGLGPADMHVAENLSASGLGQLPRLGVNALAFSARRYPCIPVFHGGLLETRSTTSLNIIRYILQQSERCKS
jgi:hypothetical protein